VQANTKSHVGHFCKHLERTYPGSLLTTSDLRDIMNEWDFKRLAKEDEAVLVQERRLLTTALQSTTSPQEKGRNLDLIKKCNDAINSGRATMKPIEKIDFTPWLGPIAGPIISSVPQVQSAGAGAKQWLQSLPSVQEFINRPANGITDGSEESSNQNSGSWLGWYRNNPQPSAAENSAKDNPNPECDQ